MWILLSPPAGTHCQKHGHWHTTAVCKFSPKWLPVASKPAILIPLLDSLAVCLPLSPRLLVCVSFLGGLGMTFPLDVTSQGPRYKRCALHRLRWGGLWRRTIIDWNMLNIFRSESEARRWIGHVGRGGGGSSDWACGLCMITAITFLCLSVGALHEWVTH